MSSNQPNYQAFPNKFYSGLTIRAEPSTSSSSSSNQGQGQQLRGEKDESPPVTPDSTTEPPPRPIQPYQEGDDVFFHTDNGQHILGTVGQITGQTCQILFGDGTQQWASFKRIKKLSCPLDDDDECDSGAIPIAITEKSKKGRPSSNNKPPPRVPQTTELPCASCGIPRRISQTKARQLEEGPNNLFKCRRCINKSTPNHAFPHSADDSIMHGGPFINPGSSNPTMVPRQTKAVPDILSVFKKTNQGGFHPGEGKGQSSSAFKFESSGAGKSSTQSTSKLNVQNQSLIKIPTLHPYTQLQTETFNCFHCEKGAKWHNSVQCNFCEKPCHLLCLSLTPSPLNGDKFWDLTCSACGTQNEVESGRIRVFSVRRKISSWSDIAHLIICCLSVNTQGKSFFDLNTDIYPFLEAQLSRLHLPSKYKLEPPDVRKKYIEVALNNSKLRFMNGKDLLGSKRGATQWAIRSENFTAMNQSTQNQNGIKNRSSNACEGIIGSAKTPDAVRMKRKYVRKESPANLKQSPKITTNTTKSTEFRIRTHEKPQSQMSKVVAKRACEMKNSLTIERVLCDSGLKPKGMDVSVVRAKKTDQGHVRNLEVDLDTSTVPSPSSNSSNSSSSSSFTSSSSSSITSVEEVTPSKLGRGRGRPKNRVLKRPLSPSSPPKLKESRLSSSSKKTKVLIRLPFPKRQKIGNSPPRKVATPPALMPILTPQRSPPSPTRPVQKVAILTSPKIKLPVSDVKDESTSDTSSSDEDHEDDADAVSETKTAGQGIKTEPERGVGDGLPRAVKSASAIPIHAPQIQVLLRADILKSEKTAKPKNNRVKLVPRGRGHGHLKTGSPSKAPLLRLRPRGRGRPAGSKNLRTRTDSTSSIPASPLKPSTNGILKPPGQVGQPIAKRSWNVGVASDRSTAQMEMQDKLCLNSINTTPNLLFNAALYGGYQVQCLPSAPVTEAEKRKEILKVGAHYRTEREDEMATVLLGRSETETRSQSRRKSELFGMQKRDLNDYDSYDVLGKRVDPDGTTRYFIAWKIPGLDDESDSDDAEVENADNNGFLTSSLMPKEPVIDATFGECKMESNPSEDGCEELVELIDTEGSPDCIDLTDSS